MAHHDDIQKLERALTETYRSRSALAFDDAVDLTQEVMRDIRRSTGERAWWAPSVLDQLVWQTATITAAVVLMVTVLTVGLIRPQTGESGGLLAEEFDSVPLFAD